MAAQRKSPALELTEGLKPDHAAISSIRNHNVEFEYLVYTGPGNGESRSVVMVVVYRSLSGSESR